MVAKTAVSAGMARPVVRPKRADGVEKKKEDGIHLSQKALLTWMIEEERLFDQISNYISPGDFTEDLYRTVAEKRGRTESGKDPESFYRGRRTSGGCLTVQYKDQGTAYKGRA